MRKFIIGTVKGINTKLLQLLREAVSATKRRKTKANKKKRLKQTKKKKKLTSLPAFKDKKKPELYKNHFKQLCK